MSSRLRILLNLGRDVENDQVEFFVENNVSEEGSISESESSMQDLQYEIMKSKAGPAWLSRSYLLRMRITVTEYAKRK